jgi:hypothetical protein
MSGGEGTEARVAGGDVGAHPGVGYGGRWRSRGGVWGGVGRWRREKGRGEGVRRGEREKGKRFLEPWKDGARVGGWDRGAAAGWTVGIL